MGWLTMRDTGRFANARAYLDDQFTYTRDDHRLTVLKSSMVGSTGTGERRPENVR